MNQPSSNSSSWRSTFQRLRVPLGFVSALLFLIFSHPTRRSLLIGIPLALAGALIRAWASGHLRKNRELATGGPYAHTRNPLYFGSFVMLMGCAVGGGSWWLGLWLMALFLLIYWPVMQAEAAHIESLFGDSYREWAGRVPLFLPRLLPSPSTAGQSFDLEQYRQHREYRALLGLLVVFGVLGIKLLIGL